VLPQQPVLVYPVRAVIGVRSLSKGPMTRCCGGGHQRLVIRTALAVTLAAAAALPAEAGASRIVYGCGYELCSISPDGSGRKRLTHDGHRSPRHLYREPSVSRSGRRLAFVRGQHPTTSRVYVADRHVSASLMASMCLRRVTL
jgi:hypothetical protein